MKQAILFIGLGRMGFPMAGHLTHNADFAIYVHNRSPEKIQHWLKTYNGHQHTGDSQYDVIVLCVGNDDDVRENLTGQNALTAHLKSGGVIIDHTTTSAQLAKSLSAQLKEQGINYLDAPVSGGEAGAINGKLSCMIGGDADAFSASQALLSCYCHNIVHIGDSGSGQIAKMANQLCIAGTLAGLSEAIMLIENAGVESDNVYQAIKGGAAQSWQLDNRFGTMVAKEYQFGFAIEHMIKDLNYALEEVKQQGWQANVSERVIDEYRTLLADGHSGADTSVLIEQYRKRKKG